MLDRNMTIDEIESWLREEDASRLETLWAQADRVRKETVGDAVHLRGLIEISNYCVRSCSYCGLHVCNTQIERYRMSEDEIFDCVQKAVDFGYGTVVMQAGEDYGITAEFLENVIRRIKSQTSLAVTLSMGERPFDELRRWRDAGADRYLLRFETSDRTLYELIHPALGDRRSDRIEILMELRKLGYEAGGGVMIGIPGQSYRILARDIDVFRQYDLDMIGVGPYIANPHTPLGSGQITPNITPADQTASTELMTYKVLALTRINCPQANIPSTTALATINKDTGRELGLSRGANIVMPNLTPVHYRDKYEIYPGKACINETAQMCNICMAGRIASIGRTVGSGPGGRRK